MTKPKGGTPSKPSTGSSEHVTILERSDEFIRAVAASLDAYLEIDKDGKICEFSRRAEQLFFRDRSEVMGREFSIFAPIDEPNSQSNIESESFANFEWQRLIEMGPRGPISPVKEYVLVDSQNKEILCEVVSFVVADDPNCRVALWIRDISDVRRNEEALAASFLHDPLTNLPSRTMFTYQLSYALVRHQDAPGRVAILLCDVDRFKGLNDSLGHDAGDEALVALAERLKSIVRPKDVVARFGGDEFLILCEGPLAGATATHLAKRISEVLAQPMAVKDQDVYASVSIGIATSSTNAVDAVALISNADSAMYLAKRRGGNRFAMFNDSLRTEVVTRTSLENSLHRALERDELVVYFQPVVNLSSLRVVGVEALVRWNHPDQGLMAPDTFIPTAEETGLIVPIGAWVLNCACQTMETWKQGSNERQDDRIPCEPFAYTPGNGGLVEVNLSGRQIGDPDIVATVAEAISKSSLSPDQLVLEITESTLMDDPEAALSVLEDLKSLGVKLAVDDFGTGFSSLAYLHKFPIDVLKIDKSFVMEMGNREEDTAIVRAVIDLGHTLGLEIVAEGVESSNQMEILQALGCDMAQGYLFSHPLPAASLLVLENS
ncbi:MAG: EAL domain-containing protein [Acidimicrobiales bacterium]|nr:EAL domain-containing protein [Acidimicrobiales bacterium]